MALTDAQLDAIKAAHARAMEETRMLGEHGMTAMNAVPKLLAEVERLRGLVKDLADPDPCWHDHHGGCQAHGYLSLGPGERCPHAVARELLNAGEVASGG